MVFACLWLAGLKKGTLTGIPSGGMSHTALLLVGLLEQRWLWWHSLRLTGLNKGLQLSEPLSSLTTTTGILQTVSISLLNPVSNVV